MAIYHFKDDRLHEVSSTSFAKEGILERKNLQAALIASVSIVAPGCLVVAEEFSEWLDSQRRIDLLAIDKNANLVVIELKRTETGEHMELQAIRYAAMVSTLTFRRTVEIYQAFLDRNGLEGTAEGNILSFLGWDEPHEEDFALSTRIVLASHDFKRELTTSVMWLNEMGLDIRCIRMIPFKHYDDVLLDIQQIIPLPEAESYQVRIRQQSEERREARESSKDYSRYVFDGNVYNKRKLVLAVVKRWVATNHPQTVNDLRKAFPQDLKSGGLFVEVNVAREVFARHGIPRHFLDSNETLVFADSTEYAISNQWGKKGISEFIKHASSIGLEISEVGQDMSSS